VNVVYVHFLYPGIHMEELEKARRTLIKVAGTKPSRLLRRLPAESKSVTLDTVAGNRTEQANEAPARRV
jgi:hypothetical protein